MTKTQDTYVYELIDGNEVVYIGTTNDPGRREREHRDEGKKFSRLKPISRRMTEDGAKKKEAERLATYRKNHQGRNPKDNEDSDG